MTYTWRNDCGGNEVLDYAYTDSVSGAVVMSLRGSPDETAHLIRDPGQGGSKERSTFARDLFDFTWSRHRGTFLHEWMHILQAISYPQLYLRAVRGSTLLAWWTKFAVEPRYDFPVKINLEEDWFWSDRIDSVPVRIVVEDGKITTKAVAQGRSRRGLISELDLIEEDATVAQYRIEVGGHGNGRSYRNWLAEEKHYTSVFSFLSRYMSDDSAFRLLSPMVRASFWSVRPLEAFAKLLAEFLSLGPNYFLDVRDADADLDTVFLRLLREKIPEADKSSIDPRVPAIRDKPGIITDAQFTTMIDYTPHLPLQPLAAFRKEQVSEEPRLARAVLRQPAAYFGRGGSTINPLMLSALFPPLLVYAIPDPSYPVGSTLMSIAPGLGDYHIPPPVDLDYKDTVMLTFRAKVFLDSLLGRRKRLMVCPHTSCGFHESGLCDGWVPIPKKVADCQFPDHLRNLAGYTLAPSGGAIVREEASGR